MGIFPVKYLITSSEIPASFGVHGPGDMTINSGEISSISLIEISSLRTVFTSWPNSPKYWTRLYVKDRNYLSLKA